MPFTFSHPAIVLPFGKFDKKWFSLTGLIIGSVSPDFEYFMRMYLYSAYSHTLKGVFLFDLPIALILAFLFHNVVRNPLFSNLPTPLNARLYPFTTFNWNTYFTKYWYVVLYSIITGVASHILWDGFTVPSGVFVKLIPSLRKDVVLLGTLGYPMTRMKLVQHSSTIIGGLIILWSIWRLPKASIPKNTVDFSYWIVWGAIVIVTACARFFVVRHIHDLFRISNVVVVCCSAMILSLILTPLLRSIVGRCR